MKVLAKTMAFILVFTLLVGCTVNNNEVNNVENEISEDELRGDDGNYISFDYPNIEISDSYVKLNYEFNVYPIGVEYSLLAFQDGLPVPFSLNKDNDFKYAHRLTFDKEKNSSSIYIKANSFKKGDVVSFGMGFINNPDYIPEINEFTFYEISKQMPSISTVKFTVDSDYESDRKNPKILTEIEWQELESDAIDNANIRVYNEDWDISELQKIVNEEPHHPSKQFYLKSGDHYNTYLMRNGKTTGFDYVTFFIDHTPIKIKGGYDAAYLDYNVDKYIVANFELIFPDNLEKGNHTFYAVITDNINLDNTEYMNYTTTLQRVIVIE